MTSSAASADFSIRALEAIDVPVLSTLLSEWVPGHWSSSGLGNALALAHEFRVLVRRVNGNEELAGIGEFQRIVDEGHLLGIAIVPGMQRRGLGMHLLQALLAEMRKEGCARCLLEVRRSNVAGRMLYQRAGFVFDGVRKDYYPPQTSAQSTGQREDALLYSLAL
jgi:ribosomal protein S18 acetylase RimI-like enzyme